MQNSTRCIWHERIGGEQSQGPKCLGGHNRREKNEVQRKKGDFGSKLGSG
jgi:hypothetical protein